MRASGQQTKNGDSAPDHASGILGGRQIASFQPLGGFDLPDLPGSEAIERNLFGTIRSIRRVFALVWETSRLFTLVVFATTLISALIPATQIWIAGELIDEVSEAVMAGGGDLFERRVIILAVLQLVVFLVSNVLRSGSALSQVLLGERLRYHVQQMIMSHANTLDLADFEDSVYYDQLQQAQREASSRPLGMVNSVFGLLQSIITFVTMAGLLLQLEWWIAAVVLLSPIPAFLSGANYSMRGFRQAVRLSPARRLMDYLRSLVTTDSFNKEIKVFRLGDYFVERYAEVADDAYKETRELAVKRQLAATVWGAIPVIATSGTFLYVAVLAVRGQVSLGSLAVYTQAAQQGQAAFQGILGGVQSIYENSLYLTTLENLLDRAPSIAAPPEPIPVSRPFTSGIEFRDVSFHYPGQTQNAVSNLSFRIDPGETIALVGRNGAGKSTIVKLLARLYDPTEGQILVDGHDLREYDPQELWQEYSVMFQDFVQFQLTASENIGVGNLDDVEDRAEIEDAAKRAGADRLIQSFPDKYDTILGKWFEGGTNLSGGEWQRIALARAFMRDAQILILDEPTAALDPQAEFDLFQRLTDLASGKMTLFISHRFSTTRYADRILVLDGGRLIEQGTHDELIDIQGAYAELFELQAASYR
ncbi:MAG: ABC transporter ATP-binding protein [Geminicoccaceae bacterium]